VEQTKPPPWFDGHFEADVIAIGREAVEVKPEQIVTRQTSLLGELDMDSLSLVRIDTLL
jgi:acyl carrier protein